MKLKHSTLSAAALKYIAITTMLLDHIAKGFIQHDTKLMAYPAMPYITRGMTLIGRLAFPLFCFLLVEGFRHTHSKLKYLFNLLLFGAISEWFFDIAFYNRWTWSHQNVYFTLALGLILLWLWTETLQGPFRKATTWHKILAVLFVIIITCIATAWSPSYEASGVLTIFILYACYDKPYLGAILSTCILTLAYRDEIFVIPAWFLIYLYNGQRGKQPKYLFYAFYPAHLGILCLLRNIFIH